MSKDQKSTIRKKYKLIRSNVSRKNRELILENVIKIFDEVNISNSTQKHVGIYWPLSGEIDLRSLKKLSLPVALPVVRDSKIMSYKPWLNLPLKKDFHGIPCPLDGPDLPPEEISILLVPALAIDKKGYRLGYGGGFFDRLRNDPKWRSIPSFAVIPSECISETALPIDHWDIPFDGWISEKGISQIITHK